jgi:steroid delta-isomerase-like uncharacterized protein
LSQQSLKEDVMATKNTETAWALFESFNSRDFDANLRLAADDVVCEDRATGAILKGRSGFREFMQEWVNSFSNGECVELELIDAGDIVVAEFIGRGVNDGPLGPLPASGRQMNHRFCEVLRFNEQGQLVSITLYYDQLSLLAQLGHGQQTAPVAARKQGSSSE